MFLTRVRVDQALMWTTIISTEAGSRCVSAASARLTFSRMSERAGGPDEGLRLAVVVLDVLSDLFQEFLGVRKTPRRSCFS
jgi:hypothetical protein